MNISNLRLGSSRVNIEANVIEKQEVKEINTKFGRTKLSNAVIEDETGRIALVLWGDDADKINEGDVVVIENGFVREWNNEIQLSVGRFGKIKIKSEDKS